MPNKWVDDVKDPVLREVGQVRQIIEGRKLTTREVDELSEVAAQAVPVAREAAESVGRWAREATESVGARANPAAVPVVLGVLGGIAVVAGVYFALKKWGPGS